MTDMEQWRDLIENESFEDVDMDFEGVYDAHLTLQTKKGPDVVVFANDSQVRDMERKKRKISNNRVSYREDNINDIEDIDDNSPHGRPADDE